MTLTLPREFFDWIEIDEEALRRGESGWKLKNGAPQHIKKVFWSIKRFKKSLEKPEIVQPNQIIKRSTSKPVE